MKHISNVFDCMRDMDKSIEIISEVSALLKDFRSLWDSYQAVVTVIEETKDIEWKDLDPIALEETKKHLLNTVR